MADIPIILNESGRVNTSPSVLRSELVALVEATDPGYTANLPGSLIEDITSTDVGALIVCDQAVTELINSLTPYGANAFLLNQQGILAGVNQGQTTNTSVYVVFTGPVGFVIAQGFTVSDGTYQYAASEGGVIASGGVSSPIYCVATVSGSWAVPANTVTQLVTNVPSTTTITVNNPEPGTPQSAAQTEAEYRSQVLLGYGRSASQGMPSFLKTQLGNVAGVQTRLISPQQGVGGWKILVGGGDPYEVAYAIYTALFDISTLVGSATTDRNINVTINDYPNTYNVVFVSPPAQTVAVDVTWNTISTNIVSATAVAQLGNAALIEYINSITVGNPINLFELQAVFQQSVATIVPPALLTTMDFAVYINTVLTPPEAGTGIIAGDSEGYFITNTTLITVSRG